MCAILFSNWFLVVPGGWWGGFVVTACVCWRPGLVFTNHNNSSSNNNNNNTNTNTNTNNHNNNTTTNNNNNNNNSNGSGQSKNRSRHRTRRQRRANLWEESQAARSFDEQFKQFDRGTKKYRKATELSIDDLIRYVNKEGRKSSGSRRNMSSEGTPWSWRSSREH